MTAISGRDLFEAVAVILWEDWDPIGAAVPADEYDTYVPDVVHLLQNACRRETLIEHLSRTADEAMACAIPKLHLERAADKLLALIA